MNPHGRARELAAGEAPVYVATRLYEPSGRYLGARLERGCLKGLRAALIERGLEPREPLTFLPFRDSNSALWGVPAEEFSRAVYDLDRRRVEEAYALLAPLGDLQPDSGVAFEVGYAAGTGTPRCSCGSTSSPFATTTPAKSTSRHRCSGSSPLESAFRKPRGLPAAGVGQPGRGRGGVERAVPPPGEVASTSGRATSGHGRARARAPRVRRWAVRDATLLGGAGAKGAGARGFYGERFAALRGGRP
ncbi:MAG TPA: hypothetical protein ENK37_09750, partial [Oceanithermus profundus]|nr:hypothetical protein [Oceanithermus profundus]